jgi:hypothetical protein
MEEILADEVVQMRSVGNLEASLALQIFHITGRKPGQCCRLDEAIRREGHTLVDGGPLDD